MIYAHSGILLSNRNEESHNICYNVNNSQNTMLSKINSVKLVETMLFHLYYRFLWY